jgi:hypothetical protein
VGLGSARPPEAALARILETAESDLADHAAECGSRLPTSDRFSRAKSQAKSATLEAAEARARQRDLDEIHSAAAALRDRTNRRAGLHPLEEWTAWMSLRLLCERVSRRGGKATRRAAFTEVYAPSCNWAVWMFNVRGEKLLAHHVFRWLLDEARMAQDSHAVELLEKNVRSGHGA